MVGGVVLVGAMWRLWLGAHYAGWEESDYGNLAMIRGVLAGGFRHYDMNHMPGYYALGAAVMAVVGDAMVAGRLVSLAGGLVALALAVRLADRLAGRRVAWLTGLLLVVQPEFALYASSQLREPVYAAFVLGALTALLADRLVLAGLMAGGAFLVRFDAAVVLSPVLALHILWPARPWSRRLVRLARAFVPFALAVAAWSVYCKVDHGTFAFWSHSVSVNISTGLGAESSTRLGWVLHGLGVSGVLLGWLLPWRIGWGTWLGLLVALAMVPWHRPGPLRTWAVLAVSLVGFWAGIGLVAQHDPVHNLYWKWLCPVVPVLVPLGAAGLWRIVDWLARMGGRPVAFVALSLFTVQVVASNLKETRRQVVRSQELYLPQRRLAEWFETHVPEDVPLLIDNIPACWINRRNNDRSITSWFDVPVKPGDADAFAAWLQTAHIGWVLWFREDWTHAPLVAPFLARGGIWAHDGVTLRETKREDGYGWILYQVDDGR